MERRLQRRAGLAAVIATLALAAVDGQQATVGQPTEIAVHLVGPKVGETAPDFSLVDQTGAARTFRSLLGPKGALLVFSRSADW